MYENWVFPQNLRSVKQGEIMVFYAVQIDINCSDEGLVLPERSFCHS